MIVRQIRAYKGSIELGGQGKSPTVADDVGQVSMHVVAQMGVDLVPFKLRGKGGRQSRELVFRESSSYPRPKRRGGGSISMQRIMANDLAAATRNRSWADWGPQSPLVDPQVAEKSFAGWVR